MYTVSAPQTNFNLLLIAIISNTASWFAYLYDSSIKILKNFFAKVLVLLLFIPLTVAFTIGLGLVCCVLYFILRNIRQQNKQILDLTLKNYTDNRNRYDSLGILLKDSAIKKILSIKTAEISFFMRTAVSLCQQIILEIIDNHKKTGIALDNLSPSTNHSTIFKPISESTLWQNRNRQYQYKA